MEETEAFVAKPITWVHRQVSGRDKQFEKKAAENKPWSGCSAWNHSRQLRDSSVDV
ncbi:MAG: hypothetical protein N838_22900 [Thiohalocapsa sp. PB-PSB1]|nr:MAG: hypothetical protein N838_22900 [Thiohalocapsa sp. PB-PSB1]